MKYVSETIALADRTLSLRVVLPSMATNAQLSRILIVAVALLLLLPVVMMLFAWPMMGMGWWMHGPVEGRPTGPGGFGGAAPTWMLGFWLVGLLLLVGVGYLL